MEARCLDLPNSWVVTPAARLSYYLPTDAQAERDVKDPPPPRKTAPMGNAVFLHISRHAGRILIRARGL